MYLLKLYSVLFLTVLVNSCSNEKHEPWIKTEKESQVLGSENPPFDHSRFKKHRTDYVNKWNSIQLRGNKRALIDEHVNTIVKNKDKYIDISRRIKNKYGRSVPWLFIAITHGLETGYRFNKHLHNGDSLCGKTWRVPSGRPKAAPTGKGGCYTFVESAVDALVYEGIHRWSGWNKIEVWGYTFEMYNGFGYRSSRVNIPSPYLWSFSTHYSTGKYCRDGEYCPEVTSSQAGAMTILKRFLEKGYNPLTGGQLNGSSWNFAEAHPDKGKMCYALNPSKLGGKTIIPVRSKPATANGNNIKATIEPGKDFRVLNVTANGNWYQVSFTSNEGESYSAQNPAWLYKTQVDCAGIANKTCYADSIAGETIKVRKHANPNSDVVVALKPNAVVKTFKATNNKLWYRVKFKLNGDKEGWIYRDQLNCSSVKQTFRRHRCKVESIEGEDIRIRGSLKGNGVHAPIIQVLEEGDTVFTIMKLYGWYAIEAKLGGIQYGVTHGLPAYIYHKQLGKCEAVN